MKTLFPLDIINNALVDRMKTVGVLFGAGKMQLRFLLQRAGTMKSAVAHLEPFMERVETQETGTIVLATVKGDVHDIGQNLVDIILTNNGCPVVNLGIKVPLADMLHAAQENHAHAIGMSGLLVESTVVMCENLEELSRQGLEIPVLPGGAALTRSYVEDDCARLCLRSTVTGNAFDVTRSATVRSSRTRRRCCDCLARNGSGWRCRTNSSGIRSSRPARSSS